MQEILERKSLNVVDQIIDDGLLSLSQQAKDVLGYTGLETEIKKDNSLEKALIELNIKPFTRDSVEKYQNMMVKKTENEFLINKIIKIISYLTIVFGIIAFTTIILSFFVDNYKDIALLVAGAHGMVAIILFTLSLSYLWDKQVSANWNIISLKNYEKPIPEYVLQTALDIKAKVPDVYFRVSELRTRVRKNLDPFLIVSNFEKEYYIEVWNEPKFQKV